MKDENEDLLKVRELPIFPLPIVLLPGEVLPLHIFEDRYQQMLTDIQLVDSRFGLSRFEPQEEFIDRPPIGSVGCAAVVRDVDTADDGRSNILTIGDVRYRILEYIDRKEPYLIAEVECFHDEEDSSEELNELADRVFDLFKRVAEAAFKMGGSRGNLPELQWTDPESLSFLVSAGFNFENDMKQRMLETTSTQERLVKLDEVLSRSVRQIEESADISIAARTNGHSKKPLDL